MQDKIDFLKELLPLIREKYLNQTTSEVTIKEDSFDNIVTDIDFKIQNDLTTALSSKFPEVTFLAEENDLQDISDKMWIIDPIDGTKNFYRKNEDYALSIAYFEHKEPCFGFVYDIAKNLLYLGITGKGAWVNNQKIIQPRQRTLNESVLDMNLKTVFMLNVHKQSCIEDLNSKIFAHRNIGSAAISLCRIASGSHEIYINSHLKLWDFAAARIILQEVGGIVALPFEAQTPFNNKSVLLVACSTPLLFKEVYEILF